MWDHSQFKTGFKSVVLTRLDFKLNSKIVPCGHKEIILQGLHWDHNICFAVVRDVTLGRLRRVVVTRSSVKGWSFRKPSVSNNTSLNMVTATQVSCSSSMKACNFLSKTTLSAQFVKTCVVSAILVLHLKKVKWRANVFTTMNSASVAFLRKVSGKSVGVANVSEKSFRRVIVQ